jgi:prepilin-type N-terminal cleavage/methylation domain-containing protein
MRRIRAFALIELPAVRRGFTLIELLVVIAIISLLVSILLPSMQRAKELTLKVICGSQMRGIAMALHGYAHDHNDAFPPHGTGNAADWSHLAAPLRNTGGIDAPGMFYCPAGCPWNVRYPRDVGKYIGFYARWSIFTHQYTLNDPGGVVLVIEPPGWWEAWSHPPHRGTDQGDSGFNHAFFDGSAQYRDDIGTTAGNYWRLFDRDVPLEWYGGIPR